MNYVVKFHSGAHGVRRETFDKAIHAALDYAEPSRPARIFRAGARPVLLAVVHVDGGVDLTDEGRRENGLSVTIWSHFRDETWEGQIPLPENGMEPLEHIFRFFNRVEQDDVDRLDKIGYRLPSLSCEDIVTVNDERWLCAPVGWERI